MNVWVILHKKKILIHQVEFAYYDNTFGANDLEISYKFFPIEKALNSHTTFSLYKDVDHFKIAFFVKKETAKQYLNTLKSKLWENGDSFEYPPKELEIINILDL